MWPAPDFILQGRIIKDGCAEGSVLYASEPIGFLGGVDAETGIITERGHPLEGQCVAGKVLVFPTGKGSTVGSYVLYQLSVNGLAPAAIFNVESEPIVAVGAIIGEIPMLDQVPIEQLETGAYVRVEGAAISVWKTLGHHYAGRDLSHNLRYVIWRFF